MTADTAAFEARIAQLEARLAVLEPAAPPPVVPLVAPQPEEPRPVAIYTLVGNPDGGYLHRDARQVRQFLEAVAVCKGTPSPARHVPQSWVPELRRLAAARTTGQSWRDALEQAGLEVPRDLSEQTQAVRLELDGLWGRLLPLVGLTLCNVNSVAKDRLQSFLKRVLA